MSDTFSTYHPILNMLFFAGVLGVTMFVTHPIILGISGHFLIHDAKIFRSIGRITFSLPGIVISVHSGISRSNTIFVIGIPLVLLLLAGA